MIGRLWRRMFSAPKPQHWTCIVTGCDEPATHPRGPFCSQHGWDDARAPSG